MNILKNKSIAAFIVLTIIFLASLALCLFFNLDNSTKDIILPLIRIPNAIKAIVAGACLSLSGMALQTISKNPLADPYLTGLSSGAGLGIAISILLFNCVNYSLFGFFGAIISAFLVIALSGFSKFSISKLILIGLSVNLFVSSIISFLILTNPTKAYAMTLILTGGFTNADVSIKSLLILFICTLLFFGIFIPKLNLLRLDSKLIFSSEKQAILYNILFIILAAFLTSISVYSTGILGFVGIVCPLLSKLIFGADCRVLFFSNILIGSSLLLFSTFLSVNLIYPLQIPLGVIVAMIGTPIFIFFLLRKGGDFNN